MHKLLLSIFILVLAQSVQAQSNSTFEFWISSVDKAGEEITTYHINEDTVTIESSLYITIKNHKNSSVTVFKSKMDSLTEGDLPKLAAALYSDSLKSNYDNLCIIDGLILYFNFKWSNKEKRTALFNYYLSDMQPIIDFVNSVVPKKYEIYFDKNELEKNMKGCPADRILTY